MAEVENSGGDSLWALVHAERASLAGDLAALTDEQWQHGTLCGDWTVEQVLAHLTAAASINQRQWLRSMVAARFRADAHNQRRLADHMGRTPAETLQRFTAIIGSTTAPSAHTAAYLGEVVVHAQDIRQPLGLDGTPSVQALTAVAEFFASRDFTVPSRSNCEGLQLRAADSRFTAGYGLLVTGPTIALVMTMAGRTAYLGELSGPGAPTLRARIQHSVGSVGADK
ncbi:maleylpyruvate isomerase family mycothiol-dependent enzyme [Arthrobacter gengyunqii]|uniref:Maleylpyruvate isomerase family mycothiol-dependent enzyme n=1 Tax=Arthrobacter gengyunqii TaxID=2886940 RepID=A0ABS8GDX9_9MICC|nr:maleylpyruvate isomerase family mycothiol-dependent enzyme [Arthrobacter gengyunqii]MCC3264829.1 maleylpyruvate isomerase family mycothiol-dependent enzyme [Arthrobacter gengyunqii]